jgi:hypothetical protein
VQVCGEGVGCALPCHRMKPHLFGSHLFFLPAAAEQQNERTTTAITKQVGATVEGETAAVFQHEGCCSGARVHGRTRIFH